MIKQWRLEDFDPNLPNEANKFAEDLDQFETTSPDEMQRSLRRTWKPSEPEFPELDAATRYSNKSPHYISPTQKKADTVSGESASFTYPRKSDTEIRAKHSYRSTGGHNAEPTYSTPSLSNRQRLSSEIGRNSPPATSNTPQNMSNPEDTAMGYNSLPNPKSDSDSGYYASPERTTRYDHHDYYSLQDSYGSKHDTRQTVMSSSPSIESRYPNRNGSHPHDPQSTLGETSFITEDYDK
ncbi:uncharacterized protein LOC144343119 [Saccoglossus kowalevskii]